MAKRRSRSRSQLLKGRAETITKAFSVGSDATDVPQQSSREDEQERDNIFDKAHAIVPPYDPESLANLFEVSNALRQNVDAYKTNIDSFGHRFEPAIDLDQEDAEERVRDAMIAEGLDEKRRGGTELKDINLDDLNPSDEELAKKIASLRLWARVEKSRLESFFAFAAQGESFASLRKRTRQDIELTGNGYWEVLRNRGGKIARFIMVPSWTMRLRPLIKESVTLKERAQISSISFGAIEVQRQFRTYVQIGEDGKTIYFKQFGDPRVVSGSTGEMFDSVEELKAKDPEALPAKEIIHFQIHSSTSPYGVPRWIGNLISVLGSRSAEEVNFFYFENKAVPPLAMLVSGGRLSKNSIGAIEDYIENNLKGRKNFHKILIIEAVAPKSGVDGTPQRPIISIERLTDAQMQDALFQEYDQNNQDKVGNSFRLPRILRGESKDINRNTASVALQIAENQVFQPERDDFDFFVNSVLLPELEARFWAYRSNSPVSRDPETMGKIVAQFVEKGVLTPAEGRILAGDIFNREFEVIQQDWTKQPLLFTLAGIQTGQQAAPLDKARGDLSVSDLATGGGLLRPAQGRPPNIPSITSTNTKDPEELAAMLLRVRAAMARGELELEKQRLAKERGVEILEVPPEVMNEWVEPETV